MREPSGHTSPSLCWVSVCESPWSRASPPSSLSHTAPGDLLPLLAPSRPCERSPEGREWPSRRFSGGLVSCSRPPTGPDPCEPARGTRGNRFCAGGIGVKTKKPPASRPEAFFGHSLFRGSKVVSALLDAQGGCEILCRLASVFLPHPFSVAEVLSVNRGRFRDAIARARRLASSTATEPGTGKNDSHCREQVSFPHPDHPALVRGGSFLRGIHHPTAVVTRLPQRTEEVKRDREPQRFLHLG